MPGGNKNINGDDGVKFEKGNNAALKWTEEEALKLANDLLSWIRTGEECHIFFNEFLYLEAYKNDYVGKIYPDLLAYLSKKYSSFLDILNECAEIEKTKLMKYGTLGTVKDSMSKFLLSAVYGLREKTDSKTDVTSKGDKIDPTITFYET